MSEATPPEQPPEPESASESDAATATEAKPETQGTPETQATPQTQATPAIELKKLTIEVAGQTLLKSVDLTIHQGERVLLVGPSGAGKSVLLRLLTGLLEDSDAFLLSGNVRVAGASLLDWAHSVHGISGGEQVRDAVGLVFQDHALLDELTAGENLTFARDHAGAGDAALATERARRFLEEHGISPAARVQTLSGGQKQRVAVARALARSPELLFYDEPTSALDPRTARSVAHLIEEASEGNTTIVVTHDYAPFRDVATRVLLLDPTQRTLREIGWEELTEFMEAPLPAAERDTVAPAPPGLLAEARQALVQGTGDFLAGSGPFFLALASALPLGLFPYRARSKWFGRWFWHYAQLTCVGSALPYNAIAGVIVGFVATWFTFKFLPRPELTEALLLDSILPSLGFAFYRIVIPVLVTLLLAGRTGAALASDFGTRVYQNQTLAMRSLGAPPAAYLGTAALWANLLGVLVVAVVAFYAACFTSLSVFTVLQPEGQTPFAWEGQFWRRLEPFHFGVIGRGWYWVLGKLLASAAGVTGIAYWIGTRPKRSTADVSRGITSAVYWGTVFVLFVHFVTAFFEFERLDMI